MEKPRTPGIQRHSNRSPATEPWADAPRQRMWLTGVCQESRETFPAWILNLSIYLSIIYLYLSSIIYQWSIYIFYLPIISIMYYLSSLYLSLWPVYIYHLPIYDLFIPIIYFHLSSVYICDLFISIIYLTIGHLYHLSLHISMIYLYLLSSYLSSIWIYHLSLSSIYIYLPSICIIFICHLYWSSVCHLSSPYPPTCLLICLLMYLPVELNCNTKQHFSKFKIFSVFKRSSISWPLLGQKERWILFQEG